MRKTRRRWVGVFLCGVALAAGWAGSPEGGPEERALWPEGMLPVSGESETVVDRSKNPGVPDRAVGAVVRPTLTLYLPERDIRGPRPCVLICPGGGYEKVVIDKEGHAIARWLNGLGMAAAVLKYRMPRVDGMPPDPPWPVQDALRAMKFLRSEAGPLGIDPGRIGILGASAGGHLAATVATHWQPGHPAAGDPVERVSSRPDFQILLYPVITLEDAAVTHLGSRKALLGEAPPPDLVRKYSNDIQVTASTPPAFIVHARNDAAVSVENSLRYHSALEANGVVSRLLVLDRGGHGFGLGTRGGAAASWPEACASWLLERGWGSP